MSKTPFEDYTYIGEGTRWYDYAYKSLHWLLSGKKRNHYNSTILTYKKQKILDV